MKLVGKFALPGSGDFCQPGSASQRAFSVDMGIRHKWSHGASQNRSLWKYWLARDLAIKTEIILLEKAGS